jgi:hypothetical protein
MSKGNLRMQMLAGIINEGQYKAKLNENENESGQPLQVGDKVMAKEELIAAVDGAGNNVEFRDDQGRTNLIKLYREKSDLFMVETLIYSTSIYWSQSDMSYEYILSILE